MKHFVTANEDYTTYGQREKIWFIYFRDTFFDVKYEADKDIVLIFDKACIQMLPLQIMSSYRTSICWLQTAQKFKTTELQCKGFFFTFEITTRKV